jgi:hypothetical protein
MEINEKIVVVTGSAYIPPEIEMEVDEDKEILIKGSVVDIRTPSNQDGTCNKKYIVKILTAEIK